MMAVPSGVVEPSGVEPTDVTTRELSGRRRRIRSQTLLGLAMLAPAVVIAVLVLVYPMFIAAESSLYRVHTVTRQETFVGLQNYQSLIHNAEFWASMRRTFVWVAGSMISQMAVGIVVALALHKAVRGRTAVRGFVLFPYLVPAIVAVLLWRWIFNDAVGVANWLLVDVLHLRASAIPWFHPDWAMVSVIIMSVWKYLPYWALFILARLQTVPTDLYEAASIDGASAWQKFRHITWPWIVPVVVVLLILRTIWAFNEFDMVFLPVQGGPLYATTTIPVYIKRVAFELRDMGAASAVAITMLFFVTLLTGLYLFLYRWSERRLN